MKILDEFIQSERSRFENRYNNIFSFTFSEIARYYAYLQIIKSRYEPLSQQLMQHNIKFFSHFEGKDGIINDEDQALLDENAEKTRLLHLEIEAFFLFAKILLDKIALSIQFYFGSARSLPLSSHDKLTKNIESYANIKRLNISEDFIQLIKKLKTDISDFRDYQIQHIQDYRQGRVIRGTGFDAQGNAKMFFMSLYPVKADKQYDSKLVPEVMSDIESYISMLINIIELNKAKTSLPLDLEK